MSDIGAPGMTGEDMRRLARDVGERAMDAATEPGGGVSLADVLALSNALVEADARLARVLDAFDPRDAVPDEVADMAMLHWGLRPTPTAFCLEHLAFVRACRACCGVVWMRKVRRRDLRSVLPVGETATDGEIDAFLAAEGAKLGDKEPF